MNELNQAGIAPQEQPQAQAPVQQAAPNVPHGTSEGMVAQQRVDEIVRDAFRRGHEKASREFNQTQAQQGSQGMSAEEIRQMARDEFGKAQSSLAEQMHKQQQERLATEVLNNVSSKMEEAKKSGKYPDYDEKVASLGLDKMPALLWHVNTVDNSADVLYDLAENKAKIAMLNGLPPHLIPGEIKKLSDSIKLNQSADSKKLAPEPFNNLRPSAGVGIDKRPSERTASDWARYHKGKF